MLKNMRDPVLALLHEGKRAFFTKTKKPPRRTAKRKAPALTVGKLERRGNTMPGGTHDYIASAPPGQAIEKG